MVVRFGTILKWSEGFLIETKMSTQTLSGETGVYGSYVVDFIMLSI